MIEISRLTKLYKNRRGVRNVSLTIDDGEILGLLGSNGSGKTTVMKAMVSLIKEDSGSIKYDGRDLHGNFEEIMAETGTLIEIPSIYKDLSAYKNLKLMAKKPEDIEDIDRILRVLNMDKYKHDKAGSFSLGMKQRLGLAAAFMGNPKTVILDEPVNGLDIEGVVDVREYILDMNKAFGTTFIISSHIASEIEKLCTAVAVMYEGEIIAYDTTEHILQLYPSMEEYFLDKIHERRGI